MSTNASRPQESDGIDERDERALTECMTVLPEAPDIYTVVGENQNGEYTVDARFGVCTCADYEYRTPAGGCKHVRRVAFATGERPIPAGVDVDPQLGEHVDGPVATDGGVAVQEGDAETDDECWCEDKDFPCFEHFEVDHE